MMDDSFDRPAPLEEDGDSFDEPVQPLDNSDTHTHISAEHSIADSFSGSASSDIFDNANTLSGIMQNIVTNKSFSPWDLNNALTLCILAYDGVDRDPCARILSCGLGSLIAEEQAEPATIKAVFTFMAKLTIKAHSHNCDLPFSVIRQEIEGFKFSKLDYARVRCCQLVGCMLQLAQDEDEFRENGAGEGEEEEFLSTPPISSIIPTCIMLQWAVMISQRRLDKEPAVRSAALHCLSKLPMRQLIDHKGNMKQCNDLFIESMRDVSWEVRRSAIRLVALSSPGAIDNCIAYLETEENVAGRLLMADRLIGDVHLTSFSDQQRVLLLKTLLADNDDAVQTVVSRKLVVRWLDCLADGQDTKLPLSAERLRDDDGDDWGNGPMPPHPIELIPYLDIYENEEVIAQFMVILLSYYMECATGSRTETEEYIDFLTRTPRRREEKELLMDKRNFAAAMEHDEEEDLAVRLFVHRCQVQLLSTILRENSQLAKRDHALTRLLPTRLTASKILASYASRIFSDPVASPVSEFCFRQFCIMMRTADRDCNIGVASWWKALCTVAGDESVSPSPTMVNWCIMEILEHVVRGHDQVKETTEWACYTIGDLMCIAYPENVDLTQSIRAANVPSQEQFPVLHRAGTILQSVLSYAAVPAMDPLLRNACDKIIPLLCISASSEMRSLACQLIGLAAALDDVTMKSRAVHLRHTIQIDEQSVKISAITAFGDIVRSRGMVACSRAVFPELGSQANHLKCFAELIENYIHECEAKHLPGAVFDALRIMYTSPSVQWPALIGAIFCRTYSCTPNETAAVVPVIRCFFEGFVKRGIAGKLHLMAGFLSAFDQIDSKGLLKTRIGNMSTIVYQLLDCGADGGEIPLPKPVRKHKKKLRGMKTKKDKAGESEEDDSDDESPVSRLSVHLLLAAGLLTRIASRCDGISAVAMATLALSGVNVDGIPNDSIQYVIDTADAVVKMLAGDNKRLSDGVMKFQRNLLLSMKRRGLETPKNARRRRRVKQLREEDVYDLPDDVVSTSSRGSTQRLARGDGEGWRRNSVKDEPVSPVRGGTQKRSWTPSRQIKKEPTDLVDGEEKEEFYIDSDDSDIIELEGPVKRIRVNDSAKRTRSSMIKRCLNRRRPDHEDTNVVIEVSSEESLDMDDPSSRRSAGDPNSCCSIDLFSDTNSQ